MPDSTTTSVPLNQIISAFYEVGGSFATDMSRLSFCPIY